MHKIRKTISLFAFGASLSLSLVSCSRGQMGQIFEDVKTAGHKLFRPVGGNGVQVYFFDSDNLVNEAGDDFVRTGPEKNNSVTGTKKIRAVESYLVKSGNVELLVDCGYQSGGYSDEYIAEGFRNNVARKIATLCKDGVLEYTIITHGDMDHLALFGIRGGLLDMIEKGTPFVDLYGNEKTIQIQNLIDFDSPAVALHSNKELENRLVNSALYQNYLVFRNELQTNYLPASSLFSSEIKTKEGEIQSKENKELARPSDFKDKTDDQLISESSGTSAAMEYVDQYKKNADYRDNVLQLNGELKKEADRFYYSLPFNGGELRILYNWFYEFGNRHSFGKTDPDFENTDPDFENTDRNNISVCFEVVKDDFKFVSFGDLGGVGEEGLLRYYDPTDLLRNVTCFKASHHGSTNNPTSKTTGEKSENSEELFRTMRPRIVSIIGCAQSKLQEGAYDPKAAFVEQKFLDHLYKALVNEKGALPFVPYLLCTNISRGRVDPSSYARDYWSNPFYGDIRIHFDKRNTWISFSYKGKVYAFISNKINAAFEHENNKEYYHFVTRQDEKILSFQDTDWFQRVGLTFGEKKDEQKS